MKLANLWFVKSQIAEYYLTKRNHLQYDIKPILSILKSTSKSLPPENLLREIETNSNGFLYFCLQFKIKLCLVKFLLFSYVTMNGSGYTDTTLKFAESFGGNPPVNLSHHFIMKIRLIDEIRLTWFLYKVSIMKLDLWLAILIVRMLLQCLG